MLLLLLQSQARYNQSIGQAIPRDLRPHIPSQAIQVSFAHHRSHYVRTACLIRYANRHSQPISERVLTLPFAMMITGRVCPPQHCPLQAHRWSVYKLYIMFWLIKFRYLHRRRRTQAEEEEGSECWALELLRRCSVMHIQKLKIHSSLSMHSTGRYYLKVKVTVPL